MVAKAIEVSKELEKDGIEAEVINARFLKPLDEEMLHEIGKNFCRIVTIEDGVLKGGMGSAILEFMADNRYTPTVRRIGLPDKFVEHGPVKDLHRLCGMDEEGIYKVLVSF